MALPRARASDRVRARLDASVATFPDGTRLRRLNFAMLERRPRGIRRTMAEVAPVRGAGRETARAVPGPEAAPRTAIAGDDGVDRPARPLDGRDAILAAPEPLGHDTEIGRERVVGTSTPGGPGASEYTGLREREPFATRLRGAIRPRRSREGFVRRVVTISLLLAIGVAAGWFARDLTGGPRPTAGRAWAGLSRDALSAHRAYAAEVAHPVEVSAKDEAHLAQWLSQRLRRRVVLPELVDTFGLTLVGGRVLPAGPDVAAQLMYADKAGARLTVYLRSGERGEPAMNYMREGDISTFAWVDQGTGYVVAAGMERERLQKIARAIAQEFDLDTARSRRAL